MVVRYEVNKACYIYYCNASQSGPARMIAESAALPIDCTASCTYRNVLLDSKTSSCCTARETAPTDEINQTFFGSPKITKFADPLRQRTKKATNKTKCSPAQQIYSGYRTRFSKSETI